MDIYTLISLHWFILHTNLFTIWNHNSRIIGVSPHLWILYGHSTIFKLFKLIDVVALMYYGLTSHIVAHTPPRHVKHASDEWIAVGQIYCIVGYLKLLHQVKVLT